MAIAFIQTVTASRAIPKNFPSCVILSQRPRSPVKTTTKASASDKCHCQVTLSKQIPKLFKTPSTGMLIDIRSLKYTIAALSLENSLRHLSPNLMLLIHNHSHTKAESKPKLQASCSCCWSIKGHHRQNVCILLAIFNAKHHLHMLSIRHLCHFSSFLSFHEKWEELRTENFSSLKKSVDGRWIKTNINLFLIKR